MAFAHPAPAEASSEFLEDAEPAKPVKPQSMLKRAYIRATDYLHRAPVGVTLLLLYLLGLPLLGVPIGAAWALLAR